MRYCFIICVFLLTACGGGGGGGGSSNAPASTFDTGTGFDNTVLSIALATDGSGDVYVGGNFTTYQGIASPRLIRLNNNGSIDTGFVVGAGFNNSVNSIAAATDGSGDVYVGGAFTTYQGITSNFIIRLNKDGSIDTGFDVGSGFNNNVQSIAATTDNSGDVYVGGLYTAYRGFGNNRIIRLKSDGSIDGGFPVGTGFDDAVQSIVIATGVSGDIYAAGDFATYQGTGSNRIIRLNSNGLIAAGYSAGTGFDSIVLSLAAATDVNGDAYVGGTFTTYQGVASARIIRLNSNGSINAGFAVGTGFDSTVRSVVAATDVSGDVYAAGDFTTYNGSVSNRIIRLNSDGSIDAGFGIGSGFDATVVSIALATDSGGDVYAGGLFSAYNGTASNRIIRVNSAGAPN